MGNPDVEKNSDQTVEKKRRQFRRFTYRGVDLETLLDMSSEQLMLLVHARARRRFQRGLKRRPMGLIKKLRLAKKSAQPGEKPAVVKTHLRNMIVVPEMIGSIIGIYNGKVFNQVEIKPEMVGHYLGEFSLTYKPTKHGRPEKLFKKTKIFFDYTGPGPEKPMGVSKDDPLTNNEESSHLYEDFQKKLDFKSECLIKEVIPISIFTKWEKDFFLSPKNRLALSAISNGDMMNVIMQRCSAISNNNHVYSHKIELEGSPVTYQRKSGRCWLFAATNVIRVEFMKKYNLSEFEFSQSYLFFYDKFEKANFFLENVLKTANESIDSRIVSFLMAEPIGDGGQFDMIINLLEKYGLVPGHIYPDSYNAKDSHSLNRIIKTMLREYALILRSLCAQKSSEDTISLCRTKMMEQIYTVLVISLGCPPKPDDKFTWLYACEYVSLLHDPRNEYGKLYTVDMLSNMSGGIKIDRADSGKYIDRQSGAFDTSLFDYEIAFGFKPGLSKADRLRSGESLMTHAMVITGVHIENGKPVKWRVQNSWGEDAGQKGWFMMTDEWMSQFVYQIVCHLNDLPDELQSVIYQVPIVLPPWDPNKEIIVASLVFVMVQSYIYDPPPPPPPKAVSFLSPFKPCHSFQSLKKKSYRPEKVQKNTYKSRENRSRSTSFQSNFLQDINKKDKLNSSEEYFKRTYSTFLEDGTLDYKTVFYNKDGYAMSSTANICTTNDDKLTQNIPKDKNTYVETPEDITAWITERKKKWPTDKNIQKKEEEKLRELDEVKDSFEKKIKLDLLENNDYLKSLMDNNLPENTNKVEVLENKTFPITNLSHLSKYFLKNYNQDNNCVFKQDNMLNKKKKNLLNSNKKNIWRVRKSLYTKLVENEKLQENMIILQAIKHLVEYHNIK
ncbi:hypothetical protein PMAC_002512 [Pneumocystis sp. 'macacae']|nr:hypothetical protein PMAC_002512 [Pneumocystis sp. 'macacae']